MSASYQKRRHMTMTMALLVFLVGLALVRPGAVATPLPLPFERWHVHVVNGLRNATLFVRCKSKDNDLGDHNLVARGDEFQWTFKTNFWMTTLYWCFMRKSNADVSFDSFWIEKRHMWLNYRCTDKNCIWIAKDDGVYLRNNPDNYDEFVKPWVKK